MALGQIVPKSNILRIKVERFFIILNCTIVFILLNSCQPTNLISPHYKRISVDSRIAVGFSPLVIIQIDFGKSPEKIGFIQIGFRINHLIKILNGKDIVLKV